MGALTYGELTQQLDDYKLSLSKSFVQTVQNLKQNYADAEENNQKTWQGIQRPQAVVIEKKNYTIAIILAAVMVYLYYEGKLKI